MPIPRIEPRYLGDGVYGSFDGDCIWLIVERNGRQEKVALDQDALAAVNNYAKDIGKALADISTEPTS
jgi:hypothetical protein